MQKSIPYKLSIRIEADGFSFVLTQSEKTLLKRQLRCNKNELVNKLVAELQLQNLSEKPFDQVEVIIHSSTAQLVPCEIYRKADEAQWLQLKNQDKLYVASDYIDIYGCYNIFATDLKLYNAIKAVLPSQTVFKHALTKLITQPVHSDTCLRIFQGNKFIDICAIQQGKLLLANTIAIENDADAAYWIMNVIEQLNLTVKTDYIEIQSETSSSLRNILNELLP